MWWKLENIRLCIVILKTRAYVIFIDYYFLKRFFYMKLERMIEQVGDKEKQLLTVGVEILAVSVTVNLISLWVIMCGTLTFSAVNLREHFS